METINSMELPTLEDYAEIMQEQDINTARQKEDEIKKSITALEIFEKGLSKSDLKVMANTAIESVLETGNPLIVAEALSAMELFIKEVKDDVRFKNYVRQETEKYPKGFNSNSGAKIECAETGTAYNFEKCNDRELSKLERQFFEIKTLVDERKSFLKTVPLSGIVVTNEEDGETWKCYPPSKTSISSYKITLSK